jgi:UDP-3-O-[3-hydroxymyristoyl] glucosamine N-acyltransferase
MEVFKLVERLGLKTNDFKESYNITAIKALKDVTALDDRSVLTWISDRYIEEITFSLNCTVLCSDEAVKSEYLKDSMLIFSANPRYDFSQIMNFFVESNLVQAVVSKSAAIDNSVVLGRQLSIGENVVVGKNCKLGNNVIIESNTTIFEETIIEDNVRIGSNCSIGGTGFGYEKDALGIKKRIPHLGNVVIKKGVEIGNNTCIDRAVLGHTLIKSNVKIDNLVHIAHGVVIGKNSLIISNVQIAGSVEIGNDCWIAPSSSIIQKIRIGNNVTVGVGSVVIRDIPSNTTVFGNPAKIISKR